MSMKFSNIIFIYNNLNLAHINMLSPMDDHFITDNLLIFNFRTCIWAYNWISN